MQWVTLWCDLKRKHKTSQGPFSSLYFFFSFLIFPCHQGQVGKHRKGIIFYTKSRHLLSPFLIAAPHIRSTGWSSVGSDVSLSALGSLLVYLYWITDLLFFFVQMGPAEFFKYTNSRAFGRGDGSKEHCRQWWVEQVGRIQTQGQFIFGVALILPGGLHVPFEGVIF